ncbi:MAG TPA: ParA family protein [Thermomicrobiales bacterium]|jgi:chromosome partitioning protein
MKNSTLRIGVLGRKGGSAKSTTSYNLGGAFAAEGVRCLLVDLDSQASLTRALSDEPVAPDAGIGARIAEPARGLRDTIRPVGDLLDLVPGDRSIEVAAAALAQNPAGPLRLRLLLEEVAAEYGAIIIDTAPMLGFTQTSALLAGDVAIVPTRTGAQQDIDALVDIFALRDELAQYRFATAELAAILPSNYHADEAPQRDGLAALRAGYGELVADPIPHSPLIERAINVRLPVVVNSPKSAVAAAFRRLAARLNPGPDGGLNAETPRGRSVAEKEREEMGPRTGSRR